jgi:hypothetical protein
MNIDKNMILVKGQDRTKDIRTWEYHDGRIVVTFNDGASFPYAHYNVEFYKDPTEINAKDCYVLKNKQPLSNVGRVQNFDAYIRIIYKSGYVDQESFEKYKPTVFKQLIDNFREYK